MRLAYKVQRSPPRGNASCEYFRGGEVEEDFVSLSLSTGQSLLRGTTGMNGDWFKGGANLNPFTLSGWPRLRRRESGRRELDISDRLEAAGAVAERDDQAQRRAMLRRDRLIVQQPRQHDLRMHQRRHVLIDVVAV